MYISPQVKILKALVDSGGTATTKEISILAKMTIGSVHDSGRHLKTRSLVTKTTEHLKTFSPGMISTWKIRHQKEEKIRRMISEAYGDE